MQESTTDGKFRLYNLGQAPYESSDLFDAMPDRADATRQRLRELESSCQRSRDGADYPY